jgi:hypothetical protein
VKGTIRWSEYLTQTEKVTELEERIIEHLAMNPNKNAQEIQRELGIRDANHPTVNKATKRLTAKQLLTFTMGSSKRGVQIKFYKLSSNGVAYVCAYSNDHGVIRGLIQNYEDSLTPNQTGLLSQIEAELGNWETFRKILRFFGSIYLLDPSVTLDRTVVTEWLVESNLTVEDIDGFKRISRRLEPLRISLQTARNQIDELLRDEGVRNNE